MSLWIRLHLILQRQLRNKATNASRVMPQRAASLELLWVTPHSRHKEQMETLPSTSKWHVYCLKYNKLYVRDRFSYFPVCLNNILCIFFSSYRSFTSESTIIQPVQVGVGDAIQDQSKAGPTVPATSCATNTSTQPAWNPFDDDDFSNLTAEEFKTDDKKPNGKVCACIVF